jgi:hypothetical protein
MKSFEVKSYYQVLSNHVRSTFPWKSIYKVKAPPRVLFVWTSALGKILTFGYFTKNECYCGGVVLLLRSF